MKKTLPLRSFLIVAIPLLVSGCFSYKELPVEYDYSYRGRFDKYNSYDFITHSREITGSKGQSLDLIKTSIESHMDFLGYKLKDNKPDLLLSFSIFYDSLNFQGYQQPNIEEWMKQQERDLTYDKLKFNIPKGTLLIQVFDRKQNTAIWQGYATDRFGQVNYIDEREVRNAVRSILNKYQFFANGFLEEREKLMTQNP